MIYISIVMHWKMENGNSNRQGYNLYTLYNSKYKCYYTVIWEGLQALGGAKICGNSNRIGWLSKLKGKLKYVRDVQLPILMLESLITTVSS